MADITMCDNKDCTLKEQCYRFKAIPSEYRQSYSEFKQDSKTLKCEYFMGLRNEYKKK